MSLQKNENLLFIYPPALALSCLLGLFFSHFNTFMGDLDCILKQFSFLGMLNLNFYKRYESSFMAVLCHVWFHEHAMYLPFYFSIVC